MKRQRIVRGGQGRTPEEIVATARAWLVTSAALVVLGIVAMVVGGGR